MPRPKSKEELLTAIAKERGALEAFLETLTREDMLEPDVVGAWSAKDVLAHLSAWEQLFLGWYCAGLRGETPALPAPGFTWNQLDQLNQQIYEEHRDEPLENVLAFFETSSQDMLALIQSLTDEQLYSPGQVAWTKKNTLSTYIVPNTSSHYAWARKELRKGFRDKRKAA